MFRQLLLTAAMCCITAQAYRVLVVFPVPSHSHAALGRGIVKALVKHWPNAEVTFITAFADKNPPKGVTEIVVKDLYKLADVNMADSQNRNRDSFAFVKGFSRNITKVLLETPAVTEAVIRNNYDAVVTEWFFSDAYAGFAAVLKCPWILSSGTTMHPHMDVMIDTIQSPAVLPLMTQDLPVPMNFWQRLKNTFAVFAMMFMVQVTDHSYTVDEYNRYFGPLAKARGVELVDYDEAINNASLLLINSHPSVSHAQALPPNAVEIGGYHIDEETPKLPEELQKFLDRATGGVVYFSMGSVIKSSKLPAQMRRELLQVLGELPYTVLWKFEETLEGLPSNVHIMKWVPQQSVLAHPNVKLFITHGGLLSTLEAVHFGVPLLAIPVFGDQPANADRAVRNGFAVKVPFSDHNLAKDLKVALDEALNNKRYYNRAKELSKLFRNRLVSPSKSIAHYIELVIESKGAYHLRSKSRLYPLYQRWLLDQLALVVAVLMALCWSVKKIFRSLTRSKEEKKGKKIKKN